MLGTEPNRLFNAPLTEQSKQPSALSSFIFVIMKPKIKTDDEEIKSIIQTHNFGGIKSFQTYLRDEGYDTKGSSKLWEMYRPPKDAVKEQLSRQRVKYATPIFSSRPGGWQFDIVVPSRQQKQKGEPYQLFFVNNNTKEVKSYPLSSKNGASVLQGMKKFFESQEKAGHSVSALTSDEDKAFITDDVLKYLASQGVDYHTTKRENHHNLGVLNRAIHTIRSKGGIAETREGNKIHSISNDKWQRYIAAYNTERHTTTGMRPMDMAKDENAEIDYINEKMNESDEKREEALKDIHEGEYVRLFNDPNFEKHTKNKKNLDPYTYKIREVEPNGTIWVSGENIHNIKQVPRYLINTNQSLVQPHNLAKDVEEPEADLDEILSFKNGKYKVRYLDGDVGDLTWRQLRQGRPLYETPLEKDYWDSHQMESKKKSKMKTRSDSKSSQTYRGDTINSMIKRRHDGEQEIWKYY